nr:hypothetical protein [Tanacetum cinerariifolium]
MVPGLAGGEWWRGCESRGKWWSGAGNTGEWSCRCGGKKGKGTVVLNVGGQGRYVCVIYTVTKYDGNDGVEIIMVNVIPPDHVDDLPIVEPNQHDDVPAIPKPVLVDEDEDLKKEEFKEEEEPQEEEGYMEVDIEEDENKPKLTYPYEEVDPLNPLPPASESKPEDVIEVEDMVEPGDETVLASVHEGKTKEKYYGKIILDLGNKVRSSVEEGTAAMENLVRKLGNAEEKAECKKLKKELEKARGFVFVERPNEAINVSVEDEKSPSSERIMPPKSTPLTQAVVWRMIKESVDAAIAAKRARHANAKNYTRGSGPVRGQDVAPSVCECTFAGFMKCNPTVFHGTKGAIELRRWFEKTESVFGISECAEGKKRFNELALMCPRMVEPESVKFDAYIRGLSENIKGENNQKQWNARAMTTTPTEGNVSSRSLHMCERCFTRHVGPCTIKCHKCRKVGHKSRYCQEKSIAMGANAQPVWTCYHCGEKGHMRNRCLKKFKQEEAGEVRGRAYAIKDAEPQGPIVVTGTFLLNNRYASVLFDSGSDRSL